MGSIIKNILIFNPGLALKKASEIENLTVMTLDWSKEAEPLNYVKSAQSARVVAAAGIRLSINFIFQYIYLYI